MLLKYTLPSKICLNTILPPFDTFFNVSIAKILVQTVFCFEIN